MEYTFFEYICLLVLNSFMCLGIYKVCDFEYDMMKSGNFNGESEYFLGAHGTRFIVKATKNDLTAKSILWFIKFYGTKWFGETIMSPICGCVICMSSLHSTYIFWPVHSFTFHNLLVYIIYVFCLAGLNTINARYA